jgi:hypothetical protein
VWFDQSLAVEGKESRVRRKARNQTPYQYGEGREERVGLESLGEEWLLE